MTDTPTEPFFWRAGDHGCLLIHGLTGTPDDMRLLGESLYATGLTVSGVCLAGHGTRVEDLESCRWHDWYRSAEQGLYELSKHCSHIVAVGLSLGSLLVLRLGYFHHESIAGLVLLSSALVLGQQRSARLVRSMRWLLPLLPRQLRFLSKESDIVDQAALRVHPGYRSMPLQSVAELVTLQAEVRRILPTIRLPAVAIQGRQDRTTPIANLAALEDSLPNLRKPVILPKSGHLITVDVDKQQVVDEVLRFLTSLQFPRQPDVEVEAEPVSAGRR